MRGGAAFTLIEVVVAGSLLAIGMLALVSLQAQALQAQRRVGVVRELVSVAEAELYARMSSPFASAGECRHGSQVISSCTVEVTPCSSSLEEPCGAVGSARATRIAVAVRAGDQEFVLAAIHGRFGEP